VILSIPGSQPPIKKKTIVKYQVSSLPAAVLRRQFSAEVVFLTLKADLSYGKWLHLNKTKVIKSHCLQT
jgi:hypothetical protein